MATLKINGETVDVDVAEDTPLLWVIREQIGLTGTKYGCGIAQCGSCTIHIDGSAVRACVYPVGALTGEEEITTIEAYPRMRVTRCKKPGPSSTFRNAVTVSLV